MSNTPESTENREWSLDLSGYGWETNSSLSSANDNQDWEPVGSVLFRVLESCDARRMGDQSGNGRDNHSGLLTSGGEATSKRNLF